MYLKGERIMQNTTFNKMVKNTAKKNGKTETEVKEFLKDLLNSITLEQMACTLTHFCFRNGPVEDMHADGKLSQTDMKTLNKYCNNKLYTFLTLLKNDEMERMLPQIYLCKDGEGWDKPEFQLYDLEDKFR